MTDVDLVAGGEELLAAALRLARSQLDPAVVNSHAAAVADGRRILILRICHCSHRIQVEAWTEARAGQGEDGGIFQLISIAERVDGEDWHAEGG